MDIHPVITVHDDIMLEVNKKYKVENIIKELKKCLEVFYKNKINLTVNYGFSGVSWGNLKE